MTDLAEEKVYLWNKRHEVIYKAELSALYHLKRERFFDLLDKFSKAVSLIGGSAAIWKISEPETVTRIAALITVSSSLSLVLSFSDRSRRHAEFARNYRKLTAEIYRKGERSFQEDDINQWMAQACEIECSEPLPLSALVIICQNELAIANNEKEKIHPLPFWARWLAHFFDMPQRG
ncbi:hypothetical protein [Noviherbaspirillum suwonense]|uniref:hypothetical protein n=1 Tax=Noviherbaspirillum suwonense TaxID=1224511 RepID=UPI0024B74C73|nr:hypothetical protein [Noviherbaspirillum suwonense]